jgi:hypothetical protein
MCSYLGIAVEVVFTDIVEHFDVCVGKFRSIAGAQVLY